MVGCAMLLCMRNDIHHPEVGDLLQEYSTDDAVLVLEKTFDSKYKCMVVYSGTQGKLWSVAVGDIIYGQCFYKDNWEII